ncbi:MAG TPA: hypothetical protein VEX63_08675, partial [Flavisolibacter sp.]|nr:hypothetical protein [Flavisolibacter sp.]
MIRMSLLKCDRLPAISFYFPVMLDSRLPLGRILYDLNGYLIEFWMKGRIHIYIANPALFIYYPIHNYYSPITIGDLELRWEIQVLIQVVRLRFVA